MLNHYSGGQTISYLQLFNSGYHLFFLKTRVLRANRSTMTWLRMLTGMICENIRGKTVLEQVHSNDAGGQYLRK